MKKFLMLLASIMGTTHAAIVVQGNDLTAPMGFRSAVTAKVFDRTSGTFFVGLAQDIGNGGTVVSSRFQISKAFRPTFQVTSKFQPLLPEGEETLSQSTIEFLALSPKCNAQPILAAVAQADSGPFNATTVFGLSTTQNTLGDMAAGVLSTIIQTQALNDANGSTTSGIVQLEANCNHFFAAVRPNGGGDFGADGSGIALICVDFEQGNLQLTVEDAQTGEVGNRAQQLDQNSEELGSPTPVVFQSTSDQVNKVALHWDDCLCRLYAGVQLQTTNDGDIIKSVVVAQTEGNQLLLQAIAPDTAITGGAVDEIVVGQQQAGDQIFLNACKLDVLHASTGPDYLIVVGGRGNPSETCTNIYALPLVNACMSQFHGTLADKNSALNECNKFTEPATLPGELPLASDPAALVGAGSLPIEPGMQISDLFVVQDAVYVALNKAPTPENDTGIFYSQALFDSDGKIERWTPWVKRASPFNAFPCITLPCCLCHNGAVKFFAVDAKTGNIWIVEGTTGRVVGVTTWSTGVCPEGLISVLRAELCDGSYSALDLHAATRGFEATDQRYALFGGVNKVSFARISESLMDMAETTTCASAQKVIQDFCCPENFITRDLPSPQGCVQSLEYSRTTTGVEDNLAYFFAGTQKGFFVFSENGSGFSPSDLGLLNQSPFTNGGWQFIPALAGSIIDIETSGVGGMDGALYVLAEEVSTTSPFFKSTLYSIPFRTTVAAMFAPANIRIIAQTGVGIFQSVLQFTGIEIIATGGVMDPADQEQLVLTTNQGLFRSNADQLVLNGIRNATNQTDAQWQIIPTTNETTFNGISGIETPIRNTVWPFSLQPGKCRNFDVGEIHQLSATGNESGTMAMFNTAKPFIPPNFNANPLLDAFTKLPPILDFFSDGGRRFFIFDRAEDPPCVNRIGVIPYFVCCWNCSGPCVLSHPVLCAEKRFTWIQDFGVSGLVLAGTENGVVGLE